MANTNGTCPNRTRAHGSLLTYITIADAKVMYEEHFYQIILNFGQTNRRCLLDSYNSGGPYARRAEIICAILVEIIMGNSMRKYFKFGPVFQE